MSYFTYIENAILIIGIQFMENTKSNIMYVLRALEEFSDENHFLTQQQIIDGVNKLFGVLLERKTIGHTINVLRDLDFDIQDNQKGKGVALIERRFDKSEVKFLIDAIFSSKSIPGKKAKDLSEKVSSCLSRYDRRTYQYLNKSSDVSRTTNYDVFLNIEIINEAIQRHKYISFKYMDYDGDGNMTFKREGKEYSTSPCYLINNFGRYYYLGYRDKYDNVSTYRLDYMKDVRIDEEKEMIDVETLKEFKDYKNIGEYISEHIYLFGGEIVDALLLLKEPYVISYITDWFGKNAKIIKEDGVLKAKVRCNKKALFYWVMQYSEHITVESPTSLKEDIINAARGIIEKYN